MLRGILNIVLGLAGLIAVGSGYFEFKLGPIGYVIALGAIGFGIYQIVKSTKQDDL